MSSDIFKYGLRFLFYLLLMVPLGAACQDSTIADTVYSMEAPIEANPLNEETASQLKEFSSTSPVEVRRLPDTLVKALQEDPDYWYAQQPPPIRKTEPQKPNSRGSIGGFIFWTILIAVILLAIIAYLSSIDVKLFRRKSVSITQEEESIQQEDIFSISYQQQIKKAKENKDWRMAIRLLYLQALKELSQSGLIDYQQEKTNRAYLRELESTPLRTDFFRITRDFEFTWYGMFPLNEQQYLSVENDFAALKEKLER